MSGKMRAGCIYIYTVHLSGCDRSESLVKSTFRLSIIHTIVRQPSPGGAMHNILYIEVQILLVFAYI